MLLAGPGVVGFFTTNQSFDELMSERAPAAPCQSCHVHHAVQCVSVLRDQETAYRGTTTYAPA